MPEWHYLDTCGEAQPFAVTDVEVLLGEGELSESTMVREAGLTSGWVTLFSVRKSGQLHAGESKSVNAANAANVPLHSIDDVEHALSCADDLPLEQVLQLALAAPLLSDKNALIARGLELVAEVRRAEAAAAPSHTPLSPIPILIRSIILAWRGNEGRG